MSLQVAHFAESFRPVINGAAVAIERITGAQQALGLRTHVVAPRFPGHPSEEGVTRLPSYRLPGHGDYPLALPWARYREDVTGGHCDLFHSHSPFALGQLALRWSRTLGVPLVTTYHTLYVEYAHYARGIPSSWTRAYLRHLSQSYASKVAAVVVPTDPVREVLREYGVSGRIEVIPTGLPLLPPQPELVDFPRSKFQIPIESPVVLYAGRLAPEKNLPLLFEAFELVADQHQSAMLLIAGGGPSESEARERAARSRWSSRIRITGMLQPKEMPAVYAAASCFLFTSLTDTQALVLVEAKAAGVPAVAVDAYGPGTVISPGVDGFLAKPDPSELAHHTLAILSSPTLRASLSTQARTRAQEFSIERTAREYQALYADLVSQNRRQR